jgi:hypothetical protein
MDCAKVIRRLRSIKRLADAAIWSMESADSKNALVALENIQRSIDEAQHELRRL